MKSARPIPFMNIQYILQRAVNEKAKVIISGQCKNEWQRFHSNLKRLRYPSVIEITPLELIYGPQQPPDYVAVCFRKNNQKIVFQSNYKDGTLTCPAHMASVQRRIFKRQVVEPIVPVRFWRSDHSYRNVCHGQLLDISGGGLRIKSKQNLSCGNYTCAIDTNPPLILEAILRDKAQEINEVSFQLVRVDFDPISIINRIEKLVNKIKYAKRFQSCVLS